MSGPTTNCRILAAAWLAVALASVSLAADAAVKIDFNGPEAKWQRVEDGRPLRAVAHDVVRDGVRNAEGAERIIIAAPIGQWSVFTCVVGQMPLLDDFRARLWVKGSRPGAQLGARIVLPRSKDPRTGQVLTIVVRGPLLQQVGRWQELELTGVSKLLAEQVRVLRAAQAAMVDPNEAYVDAIVLVIPGEPKGIEVLTDDLEIDGVVMEAANETAGGGGADVSLLRNAGSTSPNVRGDGRAAAAGRAATRVHMQGAHLLVDGKPFAPRAIEWNGEPLQFLAQRAFNAVELRGPPTDAQLAEAEKHDLWFICPPPPDEPDADRTNTDWERVLAWRLEDPAAEDHPGHFRNWANRVRSRVDVTPRPVVIAPQDEWSRLSDVADVILARHPQGGSLPTDEFGDWLTSCSRLARPGTPFWATVSTQHGEAVRVQAAALAGKAMSPLSVDDDYLERAVRVATTSGCRGIVFRSQSALDAPDATTRRRAAALELINRHLQLVGPWMAGGAVAGEIHSADETTKAVVLAVDRARVLVPVGRGQGAGGRGQGLGVSARSFVVAGVAESNQVFLLTSTSLRPLATKRVAGGTRLSLDAGDDGLIVITQDPQVISSLRQRTARDGPATMRLARELARLEWESFSETSRRLTEGRFNVRPADDLSAAAGGVLRQADALLTANRFAEAEPVVTAARQRLQQASEQQRRAIGVTLGGDPLALAAETLFERAEFSRSVGTLAAGENLLYGGDFEDLDQMTQFGWRHFDESAAGIVGRAELSSRAPQHGQFCLRVAGEAAASKEGPAPTRHAAVRIVSPPMHVEAGQLVEIAGWARVAGEAPDNKTELAIADTFGGAELSIRVSPTGGWQAWRAVRAATENELEISFQLVGQGSAEIDAVMVRPLVRSVARRLPPVERPAVGTNQR